MDELENKEAKAVNGVKVPKLGFGVYNMSEEEETESVVCKAIIAGYRHFDIPEDYSCKINFGEVIQKSNLPREEFFISSRICNWDNSYEDVKQAFRKVCKDLNLDYIDMCLLQSEATNYIEAWKVLEEFYSEGKIKVIGVSNFEKKELEELIENSKISPMLNQIETHPKLPQNELYSYQIEHKILHEALNPLGDESERLLENPILKLISKKYNKTATEVILKWHMQRGIIVILDLQTTERIKEDFSLFDFELTNGEMDAINKLNLDIKPINTKKNWLFKSVMRIFDK
ncbi:aldo/keto reductase family protein [Clostridium sp. 'White wine YQ']|uniref:aldo/keto reductase family protein n=1 Tax=Clostridium sp. 'White wine YQ' TaxID=3027474 RepID=UPI0023670789|nr:aldo/keto reductase [Clostridium sp. 'White wine YQ']MDD7794324.1 aldo/keto reductase [Clostridium sp. 'White wine YQ']